MATPYEKIYDRALLKFESYEIPLMEELEAKEYLYDFLITAIAKFYICSKDLSDRNEDSEQFNVDLSNDEIEILANYLVLEYLDSNYIRVPTLLEVSLSSTDFNAFSNANHLDKLIVMHDTFLSDNETLISRYAWLNLPKDKQYKLGYKISK